MVPVRTRRVIAPCLRRKDRFFLLVPRVALNCSGNPSERCGLKTLQAEIEGCGGITELLSWSQSRSDPHSCSDIGIFGKQFEAVVRMYVFQELASDRSKTKAFCHIEEWEQGLLG